MNVIQPRVFIIGPRQEHDYSAAARWGRFIRIGASSDDPFSSDRMLAYLRDALSSFNPEHDWLLPGGNMAMNIMAALVLGRRVPRVQILIYGARTQGYVARTLILS